MTDTERHCPRVENTTPYVTLLFQTILGGANHNGLCIADQHTPGGVLPDRAAKLGMMVTYTASPALVRSPNDAKTVYNDALMTPTRTTPW